MQTVWNPATYLEFAAYRARPANDLIARLDLRTPGPVFDLGCGPGTLTRQLKDRWPNRGVTGLDSSPEMLALAQKKFPGPAITWQHADIAAWTPPPAPMPPPALIFANASLHWVPDHARLFPRLMAYLAPGGILAVQMPMTAAAPYHACVHRMLEKPRWRERLAGVRSHAHPHPAAMYYDMVRPAAAEVDIWETHYHHVLADHDAVTAWASGTTLVPYLTLLDDSERADLLADYTAEAKTAYPRQTDGTILFTMRRLFLVATGAR